MTTGTRRFRLIWSVLLTHGLVSSVVMAEVPHLIRYQGQAVDAQEVPLEGPYEVTFRLYDAETGGRVVWQETQPHVPLTDGHFSVLLGQVTPFNVDWNQPLWLSIQVGTEPELSPRQRITSVPLAIRAENAEVANTARTATVAERLTTPITTSTISDDANGLVPVGAVILWLGATCPSGYSRASSLDGKFLVADTTYNAAAGGAPTHTHGAGGYAGPSHTHAPEGHFHTYYSDGNADFRGTSPPAGTTYVNVGLGGTGAVTGTSASADSRPPYATVLLCRKN